MGDQIILIGCAVLAALVIIVSLIFYGDRQRKAEIAGQQEHTQKTGHTEFGLKYPPPYPMCPPLINASDMYPVLPPPDVVCKECGAVIYPKW